LAEVDPDHAPQQSQVVEAQSPDQFTFSKDQYHALLALLQQSNLGFASVNTAQTFVTSSSSSISNSSPWILDSGATNHICPSKNLFHSLTPITPIHIKLPNNTTVIASFSDTISIGNLTLKNVLYVPDFVASLISIPKLLSYTDYIVVFCDKTCAIIQKSTFQMIGAAKQRCGLFYLQHPSALDSCDSHSNTDCIVPKSATAVSQNKPMLWHLRLGHTSNRILKHLSSIHNDILFYCTQPYDTCHFAKQKKLPFSHSTSTSVRFFELIHVDIWGPVAISSIDGFKYFLIVVDDFTRFTWIHLLKLKSDVKTILPSFILQIENQFNTQLQRLHSNNGKEFLLHDFFFQIKVFSMKQHVLKLPNKITLLKENINTC